MLLLESLKWIADGQPGIFWHNLNYVINVIFLSTSSIVSVLWLFYIDNFAILKEKNKKLRHYLYLTPFILNVIIVILSLKTNTVFSINENNIFSRQYLYAALPFLNYGPLFIAFLILLANKNKIERSSYRVFILFNIIPFLGGLIQIFNYGILSIWSSVALALFIIFLYVEIKGLQKDHLTGVYNRRQLESYLQNKLRNLRSFSVLMTDLDDFKIINDKYGHLEGDKALITITNILTATIRNTDIAARYAGDEFVLVIENSNSANITALIKRIQEKIKEYNRTADNKYILSMSIGYHIVTDPKSETLESVINAADKKMYRNKSRKKNKISAG
ncbi:MAG: GGDEF domain-containing protein [Spirochaetes bacterium]|nr:GGDEF domain-containing protein [Spirochaetota bacterium]